MIRAGYHAALEELRAASVEGQEWLANLQRREQERTGIKFAQGPIQSGLRILHRDQYRKSRFGSRRLHAQADAGERGTVRHAGAQGDGIEDSRRAGAIAATRVRTVSRFAIAAAVPHLRTIQETRRGRCMRSTCLLGLGCAWPRSAIIFTRPEMNDRWPAVAGRGAASRAGADFRPTRKFVPNDVRLDLDTERLVILTGPNMAGKSTYIRQVAAAGTPRSLRLLCAG